MEGCVKYNEKRSIPFIFNFPDVEAAASCSPGRLCLALLPPVGSHKGAASVQLT